jgi:hypothetical protein
MITSLTSKERLNNIKQYFENHIMDCVLNLDPQSQIIFSSFLKSESVKILERLKDNRNLTHSERFFIEMSL